VEFVRGFAAEKAANAVENVSMKQLWEALMEPGKPKTLAVYMRSVGKPYQKIGDYPPTAEIWAIFHDALNSKRLAMKGAALEDAELLDVKGTLIGVDVLQLTELHADKGIVKIQVNWP